MDAASTDLNELVNELAVAQHDLWLEANGASPTLYIDTADVRRALLGANEYVSWQDRKTMTVRTKEFERREVLVDSLLAAMFLGPFSMLPPHQAELLRQLKSDEAFNHVPRKIDQEHFLQQVGIDTRWGADISGDINKETIKEVLDRHVGPETERFFKAIQCIRMHWWDQLRRLKAKQIFVECEADFNYQALLKHSQFQVILNAFKQVRPLSSARDTSKNNLADTISLLMLMEMVRRYREEETKVVPRFFDSTGLFERAARQAGVLEDLQINSANGFKTSALVTSDGLVYKAVLVSRADNIELFAKLREAADGREHASGEANRLDKLVQDRIQPLGGQLRHVIDLSFLEQVWLKTMAAEELREIAERWVSEHALTQHFRQTMDITVEASVKDVLSGAVEYKLVSEAWVALRQVVLVWRRQRAEIRAKWPGPDTELGLFRFGPSAETTQRVKEVIDAFTDDQLDEDQLTGQRAWHILLEACVDLLRSGTNEAKDSRDAEFVAGCLWATEAYERAVIYLRPHVKMGVSFFVKTVYLASMLKLGQELRRIEMGIEELCDVIGVLNVLRPAEARDEALVEASSVAYLCFHLSRAQCVQPPAWRTASLGGVPGKRVAFATQYLTKAISYVDKACEYGRNIAASEDHWRERQLYVANQRLYYLVEEGAEHRGQDIESAYNDLNEYRGSSQGLWRSTYSDTLARYWAYLAYRSTNARAWESFMDEADSHFASAIPAGKTDDEVNSFGAYLKKVRAHGFIAPKQLEQTS